MRGRLLLVTERFPPDVGGVARSAQRISRRLAEIGLDLHVLAWTKSRPPGQLDSELTEKVGGNGGSLTVHRLGLFANWDTSLQHSVNVVEWLHEHQQLQAIWGHYLFPAGFLAVLLAELLQLPSVVSARGNDVDRLMFPPGDFSRLLWTMQRARVVTSVSSDLARKIRVLLGDGRPVHVLPNSVDVDTFRPQAPDQDLRRDLGIYPPELVLGFCGELRHKKGLPFLLQALEDVRRDRPTCLLVIGEVRAREASVVSEAAANEGSGQRRVLVTGSLDSPADVARRLQLCDVVLQPSVWDGMPNAVLEAMACGKLVIASDAGGIPEVIQHGENGVLVPRAQLHRLGEAISEVISLPPQRREEMAKRARQTMEERFAPTHELQWLRSLLGKLLPESHS